MPAAKRLFFIGLILALVVLVFDHVSKTWILGLFSPSDTAAIEVLPFFDLVLVWNYGISFGMLAGHEQPLLLITASLAIVFILLMWLYKNTNPVVASGLGLVIGGAGGNIIDRLIYGAVIDFLDFHAGPYHWPAFNIADSCIFIGVVLLCVSSMFGGSHLKEGNRA